MQEQRRQAFFSTLIFSPWAICFCVKKISRAVLSLYKFTLFPLLFSSLLDFLSFRLVLITLTYNFLLRLSVSSPSLPSYFSLFPFATRFFRIIQFYFISSSIFTGFPSTVFLFPSFSFPIFSSTFLCPNFIFPLSFHHSFFPPTFFFPILCCSTFHLHFLPFLLPLYITYSLPLHLYPLFLSSTFLIHSYLFPLYHLFLLPFTPYFFLPLPLYSSLLSFLFIPCSSFPNPFIHSSSLLFSSFILPFSAFHPRYCISIVSSHILLSTFFHPRDLLLHTLPQFLPSLVFSFLLFPLRPLLHHIRLLLLFLLFSIRSFTWRSPFNNTKNEDPICTTCPRYHAI